MKIKLLSIIFIVSLLTACSMSPTYINENESSTVAQNSIFDPVKYKTSKLFVTSPPKCIAVLPVVMPDTQSKDITITDEQLERLHWNLYSHLAPYAYQDVEISTIRKIQHDRPQDMKNYPQLAKTLGCDSLLTSELTTYSSDHYGFFSRTSVGVKMTLRRAHDNQILWTGEHIARSHAGAFPLSPIGLAEGLVSATENISDEQLVKVEDELFRRLLSTWNMEPEMNAEEESIQIAEQNTSTSDTGLENKMHAFYVSVKKLFLRTGPGTKYEAKDVLTENEALVVINEDYSPWVQVKDTQGQLGFVNQKYLHQTPSIN